MQFPGDFGEILSGIEIPFVAGRIQHDPHGFMHNIHRIAPLENLAGLQRFQDQLELGPARRFAEIFCFRQHDPVHAAFQCHRVDGAFTFRFCHGERVFPRRCRIRLDGQ